MDITITKELVFQPNIFLLLIPIAILLMGFIASAPSLNMSRHCWGSHHTRNAFMISTFGIILSIVFALAIWKVVSDRQHSEASPETAHSSEQSDNIDNPWNNLVGTEELTYTIPATQKALESSGIVSGDVITTKHDFWGKEFDHLDHDLAGAIVDACDDWLQKPLTLRVTNIVKTDGTVIDGILSVVPDEEQCRVSLAKKNQ